MPNVTEKMRELQANCPDGYSILITGQSINMLGAKEFWRIYEHNSEPYLTRVPQDFVDFPYGPAAKRIPEEWGRCLYFKVV